jgi:hypothetical protein
MADLPCDYCDRPGAFIVGTAADKVSLCGRCHALEEAED